MLRQLTRSKSLIPTRILSANPHYTIRSPSNSNAFHATLQPRGPLVPIFAAMLKASTSIEFIRMAGRITLTFMPVIWMKNWKTSCRFKHAAIHGPPPSEEDHIRMMKRIRRTKYILYGLFCIPATLFWATIVGSLERTPLTGRWRLIVLSPEEEEEIANQLGGQGWYNAVGQILAQDGPPKLIPPTDWRYQWVEKTLRRLEATIPILIDEPKTYPQWLSENQDLPPMPPPTEYPLRPRLRASEYICRLAHKGGCERPPFVLPRSVPGPPHSLLVVDQPGTSNAFSYGFGPNGAGGIVVYSGFLDDILATPTTVSAAGSVEDQFSWLFGGLFSRPRTSSLPPTPTPEQTSELAILLAHELSHLVLAHHLESLSSATVIIPGTISILTDIVRVILFPVTMIFGPFVNDALAQVVKVGSVELSKAGEYCTSIVQEIEADVVSARLLAHAGFDAREAVKFWEVRSSAILERARPGHSVTRDVSEAVIRRIMSSSHPVSETRVDRLKSELARWEAARQSTLSSLQTDDDLISLDSMDHSSYLALEP